MFDNQLIQLFFPLISPGLIAAGITGVTVKQGQQPTQQGAVSGPAVYFFKIADHPYGFCLVDEQWDSTALQMTRTEIQQYETTFQIEALAIQVPGNPASFTASDIINTVRLILQGPDTIATLEANNVGILRVTEVRAINFTDDKQRNEIVASFDFVLTHKQIRITVVPVVQSVQPGIYPI